MRISYKDYIIDINDDSIYSLNSTDNIVSYRFEYYEESNSGGIYPTTKHGIKVYRNGDELSSAIICETGGPTTIHENSIVITNDSLLVCCCNKVYSLSIPGLEIIWKKQLDPATCFAIYSFHEDFIIHGELQITRIDKDGNEKWTFAAKDIFVTPDGNESFELTGDKIALRDWDGDEYVLNEHGQVIS